MRTLRFVHFLTAAFGLLAATATTSTSWAQAVVPGSGFRVAGIGDDMEDASWTYVPNLPKSSKNLDENIRPPAGYSKNRHWHESALRGQPDVIRRVATPPGGLPGSQGALLLQSLNTGVPGTTSREIQQDDLLLMMGSRLGGNISVSKTPSAVVRVYLPPFEQWERRTGNSFAMRADCWATKTKTSGGGFLFSRTTSEKENYWPGLFIYFNSKSDGRNKADSAHFLLRAGPSGHDFRGPDIKELGWWTLGMSFTPDGSVHYYARPGVENLTSQDHIASQYPYGLRCEQFNTIFFNVVNSNDGRTWSTPWVIDDPMLFMMSR